MKWYNSPNVGVSGLPTGNLALRKYSAPSTPATQPAQPQSSQNTDYGTYKGNPPVVVPPRSQWNDMIYMETPSVSHYAGQSHGVGITVVKRKEYYGLKIYYKITYLGHEINFTCDRSKFEDVIPSNWKSDLTFLNYSNSAKPKVALSDFRVTVLNVVAE